jgi:hypothetical protein
LRESRDMADESSNHDEKMKPVLIGFDAETLRALDAAAFESRVSRSAAVRAIIREALGLTAAAVREDSE